MPSCWFGVQHTCDASVRTGICMGVDIADVYWMVSGNWVQLNFHKRCRHNMPWFLWAQVHLWPNWLGGSLLITCGVVCRGTIRKWCPVSDLRQCWLFKSWKEHRMPGGFLPLFTSWRVSEGLNNSLDVLIGVSCDAGESNGTVDNIWNRKP